ncbi:methylitaconate delta2-delta3-isomerase [Apiospora arundinis]
MANVQHVAINQRHQRQHHSLSGLDIWDGQQEPVDYSLPYPPPQFRDDIQSSDEYLFDQAALSPRRAPQKMRARESLPSRAHRHEPAAARRDGKESLAYSKHHQQRSSHTRSRSAPTSGSSSRSESSSESEARTRSRSVSISGSESGSTAKSESVDTGIATPKSAHEERSAPGSRHSSSSSSESEHSSSESESESESLELPPPRTTEKKGKGPQREKEIIKVEPETKPSSSRRHGHEHGHGKERRAKELVIHEVKSDSESQYAEPPRGEKVAHKRRHRNHSSSKAGSHRHHRHRERGGEIRPASSSKRALKKVYESGPVYSTRPALTRSQTTYSSQSHASSRRSSTILGSIFGSSAASQRTGKPIKLVECVACLDDNLPSRKTARLVCGHRMCHQCLKRKFKLSTKDPQQMPPKCCTDDHILLKHVDRLFDDNFKILWNQKFAEFSTHNRIYCPRPACGAWIKPHRIEKLKDGRRRAKCGACKTEVCCVCQGKWHRSQDCPTDEATQAVLQQAREKGWQRCYGCREMIELIEGCNHMKCVCGREFCMICGARWKTCECPWFNYDRTETDRSGHDRAPRTRAGHDRPAERARGSTHDVRSGHGSSLSRRSRPRDHEGRPSRRRVLAQRSAYEESDDDYNGGYGDIIGIGNSAGHHMNDDYRRVAHSNIAPPMPPPMHPVPFERINTGDYVSGVTRARGMYTDSMERRLADRFSESRPSHSPSHRAFSGPMMPPPPPHRNVGPPPPPSIPHTAPLMRRHTMEDDVLSNAQSQSIRLSERMKPRHARQRDHESEAGAYGPAGGMRRPDSNPRPDSALAGLTGLGRGASRVDEWRVYVQPAAGPGPDTMSMI